MLTYNSFGSILRAKSGLCEEAIIKERLINVMLVSLVSPTFWFYLITKSCTLHEWV